MRESQILGRATVLEIVITKQRVQKKEQALRAVFPGMCQRCGGICFVIFYVELDTYTEDHKQSLKDMCASFIVSAFDTIPLEKLHRRYLG